MSKTTKEYKGKKYKPRKRDNKTKTRPKKFFGHTSGEHSKKKDGVAVRDVDYVKYGYPSEQRSKKEILRKIKDEDSRP